MWTNQSVLRYGGLVLWNSCFTESIKQLINGTPLESAVLERGYNAIKHQSDLTAPDNTGLHRAHTGPEMTDYFALTTK